MLKNYLKVAWRNVQRNKIFSTVNLIGLSISLSIVILISLYIRYETSYDNYSNVAERVYRVYTRDNKASSSENEIMLPKGLGKMLKNEFSGVESFAEVFQGGIQYHYEEKKGSLTGINVSEDFFSLFPFHFVSGNAKIALGDKNSVVLTKSAAKKIFGNSNPINQVLSQTYKVTGVIDDIPANTHFKAEIFLRSETTDPLSWKVWSGTLHYLLLKENVDKKELEGSFKKILKKYGFPVEISMYLQPIHDIHLRSHSKFELDANSDIRYVYIFFCTAILILLVASINYVNLSTARFLNRAREVGVRKILGASRKELIRQFLGETFLFFGISTINALILSKIFEYALKRFMGLSQTEVNLYDSITLSILFACFFLFSFFAGLYPAFYLSRQKIADVIKGRAPTDNLSSYSLRKWLVAFQFIISTFLVFATITIYRQLHFINEKNLGFDKEQLIALQNNQSGKTMTAFRDALENYSGIKSITSSGWQAGGERIGGAGQWDDEKDSTKKISVDYIDANVNFIPAMGITLKAGRNFSNTFKADTAQVLWKKNLSNEAWLNILAQQSIILNETAVKTLGLQDPVGKKLTYPALQGTVIGVVSDFNALSLHKAIMPMAIRAMNDNNIGFTIYLRVRSHQTEQTIKFVEKTWKRFFPNIDFSYSFVDENLQKLYLTDQKMGLLFGIFSTLAIGIACLGMFGLVLFLTEKRVKEIGIRKVLGATVIQIVNLLTTDFLKPILIGLLIAFPLGWWAMSFWLNDFAYRITLEWQLFAVTGITVVVLAMSTIIFITVKSALTNPVKSLRSE